MPLVFVHGVNVRKYQDVSERVYNNNVNHRNALFKNFLLKEIVPEPQNVTIFNPYWGDYGVKFAWGKTSLPQSRVEELGSLDELSLILLNLLNQIQLKQDLNQDTVLLEVAKNQLADTIDLLWAVSAESVDESQAEGLASLAVRAVDYAKHNPHPDWLNNIQNDQQFLRDLKQAIKKWKPQNVVSSAEDSPQWETLGSDTDWNLITRAANRIQRAANRIQRTVINWAVTPITNSIRSILKGEVANFIGDVFVYLNKRGTKDEPGEIVRKIVTTLEEARDLINIVIQMT